MGTWDIGNFDNDDAMDFLDELEENPQALIAVLSIVADGEGYLETPDGACGLAAATLVAHRKDPSTVVPEDWGTWIGRHVELTPGLTDMALRAVKRIQGDQSELAELWEESGGEVLENWRAECEKLRAVLSR